MINTKREVSVNFSVKFHVPYTKAVYLVGNVPELAEWQCKKAHKLHYSFNGHWNTSVRMRKYHEIQYKFFVSNFDQIDMNQVQWENFEGNRKLYFEEISDQFLSNIQICSFNVRMHTDRDEGKNHWDARKDKILQYFTKNSYDFLGVQEASLAQRKFLQKGLKIYDYYGAKRELENDEECGIFVKKERFVILQDHYDWISETKQYGLSGYDADLPRYFTSLVIAPKIFCFDKIKVPCLLLVNLHLDGLSTFARKKGVEQVLEKCLEIRSSLTKSEAYDLVGCVIMGDFHEPENSPHLNILRKNQEMPFESMRKINGADQSLTYNGFRSKLLLKVESLFLGNLLTVDHMFYWVRENAPITPNKFSVSKQEENEQYLSDHYPIVGQFLPVVEDRSPYSPY